MNTDHIISGIHNYCDRWCERCAFIDRCTMGVIEQKRWAKGKDWEPEDFFRELEKMYPFHENRMAEWMEENGIDPEELEEIELPEPDLKTQQLEEEMHQRATQYAKPVMHFFKQHDAGLKARGIDLNGEAHDGRDTHDRSAMADAVEVVHWYMHFMHAKACRAVGGIEDMHDDFIWDSPEQSDANGSAKITILAIERSIAAWELIRRHWPEQSAAIVRFELELKRFRGRLERLFPKWRAFVRPGFDTEPDGFGRIEPN